MTVDGERPLGRREPQDWAHVELFPLTADTAPATPTPVVIGVNWYSAFDRPTRAGLANPYWIGRDGNLGRVRGGHCVCLRPAGLTDLTDWWRFYDQGEEGACVGFGSSRCMSLLNRRRYDAAWLYHEAQRVDAFADTPPGEGTTVRAGMDVLRRRGHRRKLAGLSLPEMAGEGIAANRWARSVDEVLDALGTPALDYVEVLNSWGDGYPHFVRMPATVLDRLRRENGELALVTDR